MSNQKGIDGTAIEATVPLRSAVEKVRRGDFEQVDWKSLEHAISVALSYGCATAEDLSDVKGRGLSVQRLDAIYQCMDGKQYGAIGRTVDESKPETRDM
ncbi:MULTISPECIES: hypothetical protein [Xanthomonas]|nr:MULTISPECIES: hypothetical protein [Xanthomonas]MCE4517990.1 hypothetical protein [Xanthomonas hortorum pv. vitians]WDJ35713.1 hypothetical protein JH256_05360 [Xanthomonas campestris pv. campestris]WDJ46378.1 hypothetical protein JH286_16205 [Xanthomonas campestris pv. campestris]WDJ82038.1 hypothetical protein JH309_05360 [Xanthomonas campestris pv. campestris]